MTTHLLKATCHTVHLGGFSDALPPALTVDSGDAIAVETYSGFNVADRAPAEFLTPEFRDICQNLSPERRVGPGPHLLTGPIYVRDAEPGDVLEVRLEAIALKLPVGFNAIRPGWGALPQRFSEPRLRFLPLDLETNTTEFPPNSGIKIPLHPFFGILGVATAETGRSSVPPGLYGGNLDNRHLRPGSRVFLPVFVPGALFSIGDGHAAQGDGEIDVTAIETSMDGRIQLILHKNFPNPNNPDSSTHPSTLPLAITPTDYIVMGFGETLDRAFEAALERAIAFLTTYAGINDEEAYVLCSIAVHFHITQVVNSPQRGVHGLIPKHLLPHLTL